MANGTSVYNERNLLNTTTDSLAESSERYQNFFVPRYFHQYPNTSFFMMQVDGQLTNTISNLILDLNAGAASSRIHYTNQVFSTNIVTVAWPTADCYYPFLCF